MAASFNLTAQLNLVGPTNTKKIAADIRREIGTITGSVKFKIDQSAAVNAGKLNSQLRKLNDTLAQTQTLAINSATSISQLGSALGGVKLSRLSSDTAKSAKGLADIGDASAKAAKDVQVMGSELAEFGRQSGLAIRRFAAFSIVSSVVYKLNSALSSAIGNFVDFDKELVRVAQVTGKDIAQLEGLVNEITKLSTGLGVTSDDLIKVSSTLAQAGLSASETEQALKALALSANAPSFDSLNDTVEGSIALMRQFGIKAKDLEQALGAVNAVSAQFAVEASDIITAIQRTGGVFATASRGVSSGTDALNEFIAVFTSIRATTRESSETIATGLRTIFARIQRKDTIEALKEYGVVLTDLEGKFVGPYEAVRRLSEGLSKLDPRDLGFSKIVEELGGFRQIGKVIPLIQQFATAEDALRVAQQGAGSLAADNAKAQLALANKLTKVREEFVSLIREFGKNTVLQSFLGLTLSLTGALLKLVRAGKGLFPILTLIAGMKAVSGITQFAGGFAEGVRPKTKGGGGPGIAKSIGSNIGEILTGSKTDKESQNFDKAASSIESSMGDLSAQISTVVPSITQLATSVQQHMVELSANTAALTSNTTSIDALTQAISSLNLGGGPTLNAGGVVRKFATGGLVPGSGDKDTVPAMLTPGEFVMRKTAVKGIGRDNLSRMNKYADGGAIRAGISDIKIDSVEDGDTFSAEITPKTDPFRARFRMGSYDAYETGNKKSRITAAKLGEIKKYNTRSGALDEIDDFQNPIAIPSFTRVKKGTTAQEAAEEGKQKLASTLDQTPKKTLVEKINQTLSVEGGFGRYIADLGNILPSDLTTGRTWKTDTKNLGGMIQKLAVGGIAQRKVGYIDYDVIANEANKAIIEKGMEETGQKGPRLYTDYLTDLAVKARKESSIQKLRAIYGVAGSGKTTLARGQGTDDARLRKTERFPILNPEDIQKATEVLVLSSSISKDKLDDVFSATDRTYTLSSTTKSEKDKIQSQRISRDTTGVGLEGRTPGTTLGVANDTAVGEALLENTLGARSTVLGRSDSGRLRRKGGNELVEIIKKRIGFTWGGFAPMTAGHESIMDAASAMGIPPEDFIYLVGANEGVDAKSYRTAIFDQDARVLLAKAGAGAKGATVLPKPRDFEVPQGFDISPESGRRRVLIPAKGSTTFVADKGPEETKKYKEAGYGVKNIERTGGISGTMVRDLIASGDLGKLQSVLSPGVYELISNNIGRIQNRANILPSLIEEVNNTQGVKLEEVDKQIKALGISRIDSKKVASDPEYAAKVEVLKELRAKRDKIKSTGSFEPYRLLASLAAKEPDKYGLDFSTPTVTDIKPVRTVSQKVQRANIGGLIQKFMAGGVAEESDQMTDALAATKSRKEILDLLKKRPNGLQDTAKQVGVSATDIFGILGAKDPDAKTKALQEAIRREYVKTYNRRSGAARATTKKLEDKGFAFGAAGVFGSAGEPENIDIVSDRLSKSAKVRVISGVMDKSIADQLDALLTQGTDDLATRGARLIKGSEPTGSVVKDPSTQGSMQGVILEQIIQRLGGPGKVKGQGFDFPNGLQGAAQYFSLPPDIPTDLKRTLEGPSTIKDNIVTYLKNVKGYAKGGKVDYYSLEKNSGFGSREFDTLVQFAKTSDFSLDEFQAYLKQRSSYKSQNAQLRMDPASLLRAVTPEPARATKKQLELAEQLKGEPDAGYRPILTDAQRLAASRTETRASALTDINNATRFAPGGVARPPLPSPPKKSDPNTQVKAIYQDKEMDAIRKKWPIGTKIAGGEWKLPGHRSTGVGQFAGDHKELTDFGGSGWKMRLDPKTDNDNILIADWFLKNKSLFSGYKIATNTDKPVWSAYVSRGTGPEIQKAAQKAQSDLGQFITLNQAYDTTDTMIPGTGISGRFEIRGDERSGTPRAQEIVDTINERRKATTKYRNFYLLYKQSPGFQQGFPSSTSGDRGVPGTHYYQWLLGQKKLAIQGKNVDRAKEFEAAQNEEIKLIESVLKEKTPEYSFDPSKQSSSPRTRLAPPPPPPPKKFATGGMVPGSGNRDTVPAMLNAGDFVIKKSSTQKLGVGNIASISGFASGGQVPALLTPGEFVIPKERAQKIGYSTLNRMNKFGKYNAGGTVGNIQRFAEGGEAKSFKEIIEAIPKATTGVKDSVVLDAMQRAAKEAGIKLSTFAANVKQASEAARNNAIAQGKSSADARKAASSAAAALIGIEDVFGKSGRKLGRSAIEASEKITSNVKKRSGLLAPIEIDSGIKRQLDGIMNQMMSKLQKSGLQPEFMNTFATSKASTLIGSGGAAGNATDLESLRKALISEFKDLRQKENAIPEAERGGQVGMQLLALEKALRTIDPTLRGIMTARIGGNMAAGTTVTPTENIPNLGDTISSIDDLTSRFERLGMGISEIAPQDLSFAIKEMTQDFDKMSGAITEAEADLKTKQKTAFSAASGTAIERKGIAEQNPDVIAARQKVEQLKADRSSKYGAATSAGEVESIARSGTSAGKMAIQQAKAEADAQAALEAKRNQAREIGAKKAALATGGVTSGQEYEDLKFKYTRQAGKDMGLSKTVVERKKDIKTKEEVEEAQKETKTRDKKISQGSEKARLSAETLLIKAILDNTKTIRACQCKDVRGDTGADNTDSLATAIESFETEVSDLRSVIQEKNDAETAASESGVTNGQDPFENDSITVPFVDMLDSLAEKSEKAGNRLNAAFSDSAGNVTKLGTAAKGMSDALSGAAKRTADGLATLNEDFIKSKVGQAFQGLTSIKGLIGGFAATAGLSRAAEAAGGYETKAGTALNVGSSIAQFSTSIGTVTSQMGPFGTAVGAATGALIGLAKGLFDAAKAAEEQRLKMLELAKEDSAQKASADFGVFFSSMTPDVKDFQSGLQNLSATIEAENEIIKSSGASLTKRDWMGLGPERAKTGPELREASQQLAASRSASGAQAKNVITSTMNAGNTNLAGAQRMLGPSFGGLTQAVANADSSYIETMALAEQQRAKEIKSGKPIEAANQAFIDAEQRAKDQVLKRAFSEQQVTAANEEAAKAMEQRQRLESQGVASLEKMIGNTSEQNRDYAKNIKAAEGLFGGDVSAQREIEQKAYEEAYASASGTEEDRQKAGEQAQAKARSDITQTGNEMLGYLDPKSQEYRSAKATMLETQLKSQGVDTTTGLAGKVLESLRKEDPTLEASKKMSDALLDNQKAIIDNTDALKNPKSPLDILNGGPGLSSAPAGFTERAQEAILGNADTLTAGATGAATLGIQVASYVRSGRASAQTTGSPETEVPEKTKAATTSEEMDTSSKTKTNKTDTTDNSRSATGDVNTKSSRGGRAKSRGFFGAVSSYVLPAAIAGGGLAAGYVMGGGAKKPEEAQAATEETLPADPEILGLLSKIEENTRNCCSGNSQNGIIEKPVAVSAVDQSKANLLEEQLTGKGIDTNTGITKTALNSLRGGEQPVVTYASLPTESALATNLDTAKTTIAQEQSTLEETQPVVGTQNPKEERSSILDWTQAALDVAGLIPIVGELADGANAAIYTARAAASTDQGVRNDLLVDAGLSAAAMVPGVGMAAIGGKYIAKGAKTAMKATKASANTTRNAVKYGGAVAGEAMDYGVMNTAENVIASGVDAVLPVSPTAATTEYAAQQVEQSQVGQQLTPTAQLTGVSRSGFSAGAAAPISDTSAPTMVSAGVLDQAKAEYDQIEAEKARQKAAAEQAAQQTMSYDSMSKQMSGNLFGELPGAPTSAPQGMTPTPSPGVISNMTKPNAAGTPVLGNLAGIDPAAISEALSGTFNNFITALQNIQLPKIPETITMEGRHTVEVIINGAEALKSIDQGIRDMVTDKINEAMKNINNKTEGGFGP